MMICGSCGMRMDGAAVLACKTRMYDIAQRATFRRLCDGEPPDRQGPRRRHGSLLGKFKAMKPWLQPGYEQPEDGREYRISRSG
jgi:hypothetical protein